MRVQVLVAVVATFLLSDVAPVVSVTASPAFQAEDTTASCRNSFKSLRAIQDFRTRLKQSDFTSVWNKTQGEPPPFMISYVNKQGDRRPVRVVEAAAGGDLKVRDEFGAEHILTTYEVATARMASWNSWLAFLEHERGAKNRIAAAVAPSAPKVDAKIYAREIERFAPRDSGYATSNGAYWRVWGDSRIHAKTPMQGWKLHVGATQDSAVKIAARLLPELRKREIMHKVVENFEGYRARVSTGHQQAGKFITLYPRNDREAKEIAEFVDAILKNEGLGASDFVKPPDELEVRPGIYARFGRFKEGRLKDANNREIPGSEKLLRMPDGSFAADRYGVMAPPGIENPF